MFEKLYNYWKERQNFNNSRINKGTNKILIEVAAQHPLDEGMIPGMEFKKRLIKAIEILKLEQEKGNEVIIYIPGSKHSIIRDGVYYEDNVSLATAGRQFLIDNGIDSDIILGDDANMKYKGYDGVYNSGDECFVAKQLFDDEKCDRLISVVSPVQVFRKAMFYNEFGVNPEIYSVPLKNTAHNYVGEFFWSLYITTFLDHTWQGDKSFLSVLTRMERCKGYQCNDVELDTLKGKKIVIPEAIGKIRQALTEKYQYAKMNMSRNDSNNVLIELYLVGDDYQYAIDEALKLLEENEQEGKKMTIILTEDNSNVRKVFKGKNVDIVVREREENFDYSNYGTFYCICPSSLVMEKSMISIIGGVFPLIISYPNKNENYVDSVFNLYDVVIGKELISSSYNVDTKKETTKNVVLGLLSSEIDVELLDDVDSYRWSSSMSEGESSYHIDLLKKKR